MTKKEFLEYCENFIKETGVSATNLGWRATGNPQLIFNMRKGRESREETQQKVFEFVKQYKEAH